MAVVVPPMKSEPAYCCFTLEVMKTLRSSAKPAPDRAGWYEKISLRPASAAKNVPTHASPSAPFS